MKTPPLLLAAVLAFWGWQTGFLVPGLFMGLVIEGARLYKTRWDFSDDDFARIWTLCLLVFLAALVYAFSANDGPADFRNLFHGSLAQRGAGIATSRTASSLLRWLPMVFFLFVAAQAYSSRPELPLHVISLILRYRWRHARKLGLPAPLAHTFNLGYPFFALCLFSASIHAADDTSFFWGFCALAAWALWPQRSPRFALPLWAATLVLVIGASYFGQRGISQFQSYLANLNPQWLTGFIHRRFDPIQSQTEIGQLGRIKTSSRIVIRLEAKSGVPPKRLRETTFRSFKGRTWYSDLTENDFSLLTSTNETSVPLLNKPTTDSVNISCYLPGGKALLPLPEGSARLEHLLFYNIWKSPLGGVLEDGPGLVVFDALYGPGKTIDEPADESPDSLDLSLPEHDTNTLAQVVSELHLEGQTLNHALLTLAHFFSTRFTYSTWQEQPRAWARNETPLKRFLLHSRSGHCEYFATAAVLLLRSVGFPARYAVGYAVHEGSGQEYVVRQRDAHAWCLVWDHQRRAWRDFDPTPPSWVAADAQHMTLLQRLADLWARLCFEISKFRWGQSHVRQYLFYALTPIMAFLLYQIIFRKRHGFWRTKNSFAQPAWPGLDSEFYQLIQALAQRGLARDPCETLSEWLRRVARDPALSGLRLPLQEHLSGFRATADEKNQASAVEFTGPMRVGKNVEVLEELLALHYRYRFDPQGLNTIQRDLLRTRTRDYIAALAQAPQPASLVGSCRSCYLVSLFAVLTFA